MNRIDTTRRLARVLATDIAAAVLLVVFIAVAGVLWLVVLTPLLFVAAIVWLWFRAQREPTEIDRYCSSVDIEWDELAARRATAPDTCGVVIDFPRRPAA